jgi:hypothetical protein
VEGVAAALAFAPPPMPGFRACPKPARGLETVALGTKSPPVLAGGADGRDRDGPPIFSSDIWRTLSLNSIGSVRSSNFPASCRKINK